MFCLYAALIALTAGFGWRLIDLQLMPDEALASEIGSQVRHDSIAAPRGRIVDRHGRPIALSLPRPSIVANPRLLQAADKKDTERDLLEDAVTRLSGVLTTDPDVLRERLARDKAFVYLERQVDPRVGEAVRALGIAGVHINEEQRREHPHGGCSGLGVVGRVDIDQIGVSGIELAYDEHLTGSPGVAVRQTQGGGQVQLPGGFQVLEPMTPGADLALTIDRYIQFEAEQMLSRALEESAGDHAIAIVSDPDTGEILAMANVTRDPETGSASCTTTNLAATWVYEPGSIMKSLTFASIFENDAWPEFLPIDIPHRLRVGLGGNVAAHFYVDRSVPVEGASRTPTWVLRKSSNNGTITMAQELGPDALYETLTRFGLGQVTALDLSGEASGILDPLDSHVLELSSAAIGQSVAVTPLQMLLAYNTLATGGLRMDPVLVLDEVGSTAPKRVVSSDTADTLMRMMTQVVIDGTGRRGAIPGYTVSGKTGTAWQPCDDVGYVCLDGGRHLTASFAGIVSNDQGPALSAIVVIDNPADKTAGGGSVAAPVFADLAAYALRQLRIAPTSGGLPIGDRVRAEAAVPVTTHPGEEPAGGPFTEAT